MSKLEQEPMQMNKEQKIQEFIKDIPEDKREDIEYALRHLLADLRELGKTEEQIQEELDRINFPKELR